MKRRRRKKVNMKRGRFAYWGLLHVNSTLSRTASHLINCQHSSAQQKKPYCDGVYVSLTFFINFWRVTMKIGGHCLIRMDQMIIIFLGDFPRGFIVFLLLNFFLLHFSITKHCRCLCTHTHSDETTKEIKCLQCDKVFGPLHCQLFTKANAVRE